jgi:polysaccharide export outer membrane protein
MLGAVMLLAPILLVGCQTHHDFSAFVREPRPLASSRAYCMQPPDVVQITSKRVREINGHTETIRPDGYITLPLLGSVFVAGRTPEEVTAELQEKAREYYDDADVSLRIAEYRSKKIYVFGEVTQAGAFSYNGANTVLGTLARAQPSRLSDPSRVQVLRPNADGKLIRRMTVDLNRMVKDGDTTLDAVLEEGDIIYVPANPLAAVGLTLQQVLLPITPAASTVQGPTSIDRDLSNGPYTSTN